MPNDQDYEHFNEVSRLVSTASDPLKMNNIAIPPPPLAKSPKLPKAAKALTAPKQAKPKSTAADLWALTAPLGAAAIFATKGVDAPKISRYAFSGSHQEFGPYVVTGPAEFSALIKDLVGQMMSVWPEKNTTIGLDARFTELSAAVAMGAHSHPGKYVNASTSKSWLVPANSRDDLFLTSQSAGAVRWMSAGFSHDPGMSGPGILLYASFQKVSATGVGEIVTLGQLLASSDPAAIDALIASGVDAIVVAKSCQEWAAAFANVNIAATSDEDVGRHLPTLLWPSFDNAKWQYDAITALPSLAVYNAIKKMGRAVAAKGMRLPSTSFEVGSGQAQNISVAATHTAGAINLLICVPPRIIQSDSAYLLRRATSRKGAGLVQSMSADSAAELGAAASAIRSWPNQNRQLKLRFLARKHVLASLALLLELRDLLDESPERAQELSRLPVHLLNAATGNGVRKEERVIWIESLLDPVARPSLAKHDQQDQKTYRNALWGCLLKEFGLSAIKDAPTKEGM